MPSQRLQRVSNLLRAEISTILLRKIKDPRISLTTITEINVAPDLKNATIFVSVYGNSEQQEKVMQGLGSAANFIRSELMRVLDLRPIPQLQFKLDEALARGTHILDILDQVLDEEQESEPDRNPGNSADREQ